MEEKRGAQDLNIGRVKIKNNVILWGLSRGSTSEGGNTCRIGDV